MDHGASTVGSRRWVAVAIAAAIVSALTVACGPPAPPPPPPPPRPLQYSTDAEASAQLVGLAPTIQSKLRDPAVLANIPEEYRDDLVRTAASLDRNTGRLAVIGDLRRILAARPDVPPVGDRAGAGVAGEGSGGSGTISSVTPLSGVRDIAPTNTSATGSFAAAASTATCGARDGVGTLSVPAEMRPGQLLTPAHDVFAVGTASINVGQTGPIYPAGEEPEAGAGAGIVLRRVGLTGQQALVRVNLQDPYRRVGPRALRPLISIRPLGGTPAQETYVPTDSISGGKFYCYAGDTEQRGYWEGWINFPRSAPGFQVIAEVVDNDWYFQNVAYDPFLAAAGPQLWAGADRSTIHIGTTPVTRQSSLPNAVGAFVTALPDAVGGNPNVLTDTNGNSSDDLESTLVKLINARTVSAANGKAGTFLWGNYALGAYLQGVDNLNPVTDLEYTGDGEPFAQPDEPAGVTGAIRGRVRMDDSRARLTEWFLGVPCTGASVTVDAVGRADVWADGTGSILPEVDTRIDINVGFDRAQFSLASKLDWLNPACWMAYVVNSTPAYLFGGDAIADGVKGAVEGPNAALQKLVDGLDVNELIPDITLAPTLEGGATIGSATLQPWVGNLEPSWCGSYARTTDCTDTQSLFGVNGVQLTADATLLGGRETDQVGYPLGGRFRNVYAPPLQSSTKDLTTSQRDVNGQLAGLGIVVDPALVNVALRHLAQGPTLGRTTAGLLDIKNLDVGGVFRLTSRPEVAPMITGIPTPGPTVCPDPCPPPPPWPNPPYLNNTTALLPDLRLSAVTGPGSPIELSVSGRAQLGMTYDAGRETLSPTFGGLILDVQVTGGCQSSAYYGSYLSCGRGVGTAWGGPVSLVGIISAVANHYGSTLQASLGSFGLPSLDKLLPGMHSGITNIRFAQRGGLLTVYADIRPLPRIGIAVTLNDAKDKLRFFPSNLLNIDLSRPTTYTWEIRDAATGQVVGTLPDPLSPATAVDVPLTSFQVTKGNFGDERNALATLRVTQAGLAAAGSVTYTWYPPRPPDPCNPLGTGTGVGLRSIDGGTQTGDPCPP